MNSDSVLLPAAALILSVILLASAVSMTNKSKAEMWAQFKKDHHCKITEKREGYSSGGGVGFSTSGHAVFISDTDGAPDQTAYLCDDGVTYWKNE